MSKNTITKTIKNPNYHNKSQQLFSTTVTQIQRYDTNKIFEQFKSHLLRTEKKQHNKNFVIDNQYKDLLCMVRKSNVQKKQKLQKLSNKYQGIKKSNNAFNTVNTFNTFEQTNHILKTVKNKDVNLLLLSTQQQQDNFIAQKQPSAQLLQSKIFNHQNIQNNNINISQHNKFKPIRRPMTTENSNKKFRINTAASGERLKLNESTSHNRLISQVSRLISPGSKSQSRLLSAYMQRKSHTTILLSQNHPQKSFAEISQSIMMVQLQQTKLKQEITSLSQSMNKLTKQLAEVKKQFHIQQRNEQKYKHISNLATSIMNQTQYIKLQNQKGLTKMLTKQDQTITQLKKFKMNLRKQKDDMESNFIDGINQFVKYQQEKNANKNKQLLFMMATNEKDLFRKINQQSQQKSKKSKGMKFQLLTRYNINNNSTKHSGQQSPKQTVTNTKLMKKLINELDNIIQLFKQKQLSFQSIKQQQCTRVRLCKINKQLLPKQRVQILSKIQQFQSNHDMKIVSMENLMLKVYHSLYGDNQKLQADCLKLTQAKEETNQQFKKIMKKHGMEIDAQIKEDKLVIEQLAQEKKLNSQIRRNSMIFVKIIEGFYNILFKYRYMFSMVLTLDVDKKLFRDTVIQIDSLFRSGLMSGFCADKFCSGGNEKYDILSQCWFSQALKQKEIAKSISKELTQIMFNDHRIGFMVKKSWIESYLNKLSSNSMQNQYEILNIIDTFHNDCSQIYQQKLPNLSSLFLSCFKSLRMTKYESKLAASSIERGEIFLPNRPVKKLCYPDFKDHINDSTDKQQQEDTQMRNSKKNITFTNESSTNQQNSLQKNPTKVIFNLQSMKNRSHKKFKALNFSSSGKTYKYNDSIIIPNFHMIDKCEDF